MIKKKRRERREVREKRREKRRDETRKPRRKERREREEERRGIRQQRTCAAICMSAPAAISAMAMSVCPLQQAFIKAVSPA